MARGDVVRPVHARDDPRTVIHQHSERLPYERHVCPPSSL